MNEQHQTQPQQALNWYESKQQLIIWMLFFFPRGIYGVWKNTQYSKDLKWKVSIAVVVLYLILVGLKINALVWAFITCPAGFYLLSQSSEAEYRRYGIFIGIFCLAFILAIVEVVYKNRNGSNSSSADDYYSSCAKVYTASNGCTYYRDDNCTVIGSLCP